MSTNIFHISRSRVMTHCAPSGKPRGRFGTCSYNLRRLIPLLLMLTIHPYVAAEPSLDALITAAINETPSLESLQNRVQAAEAAQRKARAAYYPQLGASAQYLITDNAPQAFMLKLNQRQLDMSDPAFDPNQPDDTENIQMSLGIQYSLFNRSRGPQRQTARLHTAWEQENLSANRNALVHAVTQGYYQVLEAQAFARVQDAAQKSFAESLRIATERYESGAVVRTDVLNLEVQLAQANENVIRAQNGMQLAIAALNATIGRDIVPEEGLQEPELDIAGWEWDEISPSKRPELAAAKRHRDVAQQQISLARAARYPNVYAFGSVIWDGEDIADRENSYIAGVAVEWSWFDGGLTRARTDQARAMYQSASANKRDLYAQLHLESKQATLHLQEAWQRIEVTEHALKSADEALRITRALYEEGATDIASLLVAETARTETRMRAAAARYDYLIAKSNAQRVAGTLGEHF